MRFDLLYQSSAVTALGAVRIIGEITGGRGVEPRHMMRTIDTYGLTMILAGTGEYQSVGGQHYDLVPGSLILTHPGRPHAFGTYKGQTWDEVFAIFTGPLFDLLVEKEILNPKRLVVQLEQHQQWATRMRSLARLDSQGQVQMGLAAWLMDAIQSSLPRYESSSSSDWLSRATAILESNLSEAIAMESVADYLEIGYETFRKEFARLTGVSPMKYRTLRRLSLAAGLLSHTALPINEIARRLGYPDGFTFSKAFKRQYEVSPMGYRSAGR